MKCVIGHEGCAHGRGCSRNMLGKDIHVGQIVRFANGTEHKVVSINSERPWLGAVRARTMLCDTRRIVTILDDSAYEVYGQ